MASVFQRSGRWYLRWRDASGRWRQKVSTARTKTEARRLAGEVERQAERRRLGLEEALPEDGGGTLKALLERWMAADAHKASAHTTRSAVRRHLLGHPIARLSLAYVRSSDVENLLAEKQGEGLAPQTLNHLRGFLHRAFSLGRRRGWWQGQNPVTEVRPHRIDRGLPPDYLKHHEVPRVLAALRPRWRPLFATAIYTGMRKGELLALRRSDLDLEAQLLTVRRSHERETTKGGHSDVIPIHKELLPFLVEACDSSPSELVFPHVCYPSCRDCPGPGGRMRPDVALEGVLRRAMARSGIVLGYQHVCRRKGCRHMEEAPDDAIRSCPEHGVLLWPKPRVRPIRFHDLRHTAASLLMQAGIPVHVVQRMLRHRDPRLTANVYGHLAPDYLLREVNRLQLAPLAASLLHGPAETPKGPKRRGENPSNLDPFGVRAIQDSNLWPLAPEANALSS
jgi:integrase